MLTQRVPIGNVARAALISGTVMSIGDTVCQRIQKRNQNQDLARTARFGLVGLTLHGPFFLFGYQALDRHFGASTSLGVAFQKTMAGQVTLFPVYLIAFFTYMGILEGKGLEGGIEKIKTNLVSTFTSGSVFWPIANMINFRYVPSTGRLLFVNACGLVWNTFLSWKNSQTQRPGLLSAAEKQQ